MVGKTDGALAIDSLIVAARASNAFARRTDAFRSVSIDEAFNRSPHFFSREYIIVAGAWNNHQSLATGKLLINAL